MIQYMHATPVLSSETLGTSRVQNVSSWCWLWSAEAPWVVSDRLASFCRLCIENAPQHTSFSGSLHISDGILTCPFRTSCAEVFKCSRFCCAASCMKECMQVWAHGGMCEYKWSLYFQKWSIVLGINGKLDHPVIACNCIPCEYTKYSTSSGTGLCFLRWWLWRGLSFFLFTLLSQLEMFKTRRCFSRSYDPLS